MRRLAILAIALVAVTAAVPAHSQQSESQLRDQIEASKKREQALGGAVARLDALITTATRQVNLMHTRVVRVRAELDAALADLAETQREVTAARIRLLRLRTRLQVSRNVLSQQLVAAYKGDQPDVISVVFRADGFTDLLNRVAYARRISDRSAKIVDDVRVARERTADDAVRLARIERRRRKMVDGIDRRRRGLEQMAALLQSRRDQLAQARAARAAALAGAAAGRRSAEATLNRLLAERARAAAAGARSYGPWTIPWPIVQCESGGQNHTPNWAGASGYYQFMPATWRGLGGSTPHAYQAPKAEQDRLAARLWAGGAGRRNWVCAGMVD
jgi:peptidoglycan hydrolase CwlO-like protein